MGWGTWNVDWWCMTCRKIRISCTYVTVETREMCDSTSSTPHAHRPIPSLIASFMAPWSLDLLDRLGPSGSSPARLTRPRPAESPRCPACPLNFGDGGPLASSGRWKSKAVVATMLVWGTEFHHTRFDRCEIIEGEINLTGGISGLARVVIGLRLTFC